MSLETQEEEEVTHSIWAAEKSASDLAKVRGQGIGRELMFDYDCEYVFNPE